HRDPARDPRRPGDRADQQGVPAPRVPDAPQEPGAVARADHRAHLGHAVRRRDQRGGRGDQPAAAEDRRRRGARAHPDGARRRLRPRGAPRVVSLRDRLRSIVPARFRTLRAVLVFWYSGILLVVYLAAGGAVYGYLRYEAQRAIRRGLRAQTTWI